jgi:o-succinylbenzoate---CoA ligase
MDQQGIRYNNSFINVDEIKEPGFFEGKEEWERTLFEFVLDWFSTSDSIVQKTSGSTGEPKLIGLKKKAMTASALKTIQYLGLNSGNTCWLCLPVEYIAGKMMVVRAITAGLNLVATVPAGTPEIPDQEIDFVAMVPLQVDNLIEKKAELGRIRKIIIGGSSIGYNLERKIQQISSMVYATYGMTETCSHIALQRMNGPNPDSNFLLLPGIGVYVNKNGCLVIDAPEFSDLLIVTSDRAEMSSNNGFRILGRVDDIINSGGIKISPELLEKEISRIINCECLIVPFPDGKLGQKAVLVLEKTDQNVCKGEKAIWLALKKNLKKHEVPKSLIWIDLYARKENFKIDRTKTKWMLLENIGC